MDVDEYMEKEELIKQIFGKYAGSAGYTWHLNYDIPRLLFKIDVWGEPYFSVSQLKRFINTLDKIDSELREHGLELLVYGIDTYEGVGGEIDRL